MKKSDLVFTIGYKGNTAIVDKAMRRRYRGFNTIQLYEEGLLKPATASAIYEFVNNNPTDLDSLLKCIKSDFDEEMNVEKLHLVYGIAQNTGDSIMLI